MKPEELRIGNYYNSTKFGKPVKCEMADIVEIYKRADGVTPDKNDIAEIFEFIPLTEDWLIKFGFKLYDKKYFIGFNYGRYSVKRVGDVYHHWYLNHEHTITKRITSNIRHVHQLQNLYSALTGKEIEAI